MSNSTLMVFEVFGLTGTYDPADGPQAPFFKDFHRRLYVDETGWHWQEPDLSNPVSGGTPSEGPWLPSEPYPLGGGTGGIPGPPGPAGATGPTGATGPAGPTGASAPMPTSDFIVQMTVSELISAGTTQVPQTTRYFNVVGEATTGASFNLELPTPTLGAEITFNGFFFEHSEDPENFLIVPTGGAEIKYGPFNIPGPSEPFDVGLFLPQGVIWNLASDGSDWYLVGSNQTND